MGLHSRLGFLAGVTAFLTLTGSPSAAQAASITAASAVKNAGNTADFTNNGPTDGRQWLSAVTGSPTIDEGNTHFKSRYSTVDCADSGIFTNSRQQATTNYNVNFTVNGTGPYKLTVTTSTAGARTIVDDGGGTATATNPTISGSYSGPGTQAGNLTLATGGSTSSDSTTNVPFSGSVIATITGNLGGTPANHDHALTYTSPALGWDANSPGGNQPIGADEAAVRFGIACTLSSQTAGTYPGQGSRAIGGDGHFVDVKLSSYCGDGTIDGTIGEQCDQGGANGTAGSCCTVNCTVRTAGETCRPSAGDCDLDDTCTGASGVCPADGFLSSAVECRASAGVCDVADNCTGSSAACPADAKSAAVCRAAAGVCDVAESCDSVSNDCPADAVQPNTAICRASAGACDVAENCNGANVACPADSVSGAFVTCRPLAGACDVAENCDGASVNCPADAVQPSSALCRAVAGACDVAENCTGSGVSCPPDAFRSSSTVCRATAGVCDVAENCTGSAAACPTDGFLPASTVCRPAVDACDVPENCSGALAACPADVVVPDGDSDSVCNAIDNCPLAPNPTQDDGDLDGDGNACDPCTNVLPSFADRQKIIISKLQTPDADDKLRVKGRFIPFLETPLIKPEVNGVRLILQDKNLREILNATIPGGLYSTATKAGWRVNRFPQGMTAQYKNPGTILPTVSGITMVKFVIKNGQGITKLSVLGKNGSYTVAPGEEPVKFTLVADLPLANTGQCGEMVWPNSPRLSPYCQFSGSGATLRCK